MRKATTPQRHWNAMSRRRPKPAPAQDSWWLRPMTRDEFYAMAEQRGKELALTHGPLLEDWIDRAGSGGARLGDALKKVQRLRGDSDD